MSLNIKLQLNGMKRVTEVIDGIEKRAKNNRVAFEKLAILGFKDVQQHFKDESGKKSRWQPLSPSTISGRRKGKKKRSPKILQDTGYLRNSLMPTGGNTRFIPDGVILYTNVAYAAIHNFGGNTGRNLTVRMPKREFMWISNNAKDQMRETLSRHIMKHGS